MNKIAVVMTLLIPAIAAADGPVTDATDLGARSRAQLTLGAFTPTGTLGVEYAHNLHPNFEVAGGAGVGFSGPQVAVMPRFRIGRGAWSFATGAGASAGRYELLDLCLADMCGPQTATNALWLNGEAGGQWTSKRGMTVGFFGGVGYLAAHGECGHEGCESVLENTFLPYGGISLGHTL